jgi:DeoR family galactitol utilization operon repressor
MRTKQNPKSDYIDEFITERQEKILDILTDRPGISVLEMSKILGVTDATVRNDLNFMSNRGLIIRTHGKAMLALHPNIVKRQQTNLRQKTKIARKAAEMMQSGDTVFIDSGTTTAMIPRFLLGKRDIYIITNSLLPIQSIRRNPSVRFTMVGGDFRLLDECFIGPLALDAIKRFNAKYAFIGTIGFSAKYGVTASSLDIAEVIRQMARCSDNVILCADSSKCNKKGNANTISLSEVDYLITDSEIDKNFENEVMEQGVKIITV